jgi:hypothetical protein
MSAFSLASQDLFLELTGQNCDSGNTAVLRCADSSVDGSVLT